MICPVCYDPKELTVDEIAAGKTLDVKNAELATKVTLKDDICPECKREWAYETDEKTGRISNIWPVSK